MGVGVDKYLTWMASALMLCLGMALGAMFYASWQRRRAQAVRRVPRESRIVKRALVNSREKRVWLWLAGAFPQHHVMVKMPVTRFTTPLAEADREQWFALLSDVYCSFSVATPEGTVIGCVDVPGPNGLSKSNLAVKRKLFSRCDVPYWVVEAGALPNSQDIVAAFIPSMAVTQAQLDAMEAAVSAGDLDRARAELQATVTRQRRSKSGGERVVGADDNPFVDSVLSPDWAPDSFQAPLDSRQADFS